MKTTAAIVAAFLCNGMLLAQNTPFVDDWEGAPDQFKIRAIDKNEYAPASKIEIPTEKIPTEKMIVGKKKKTPAKDLKKMAIRAKKNDVKLATK